MDSTAVIPNLKDRIPKLEPRRRRTGPANSIPVPTTPALPPPPNTSNWTFKTPTRRILSPKDHEIFLKSPTYDLVLAWVFGLTESVAGIPASTVRDADLSEPVKTLLKILDEAEDLAGQSPPDDQGGSRFGNKAFRGFVELAKERSKAWHQSLGVKDDAAIAEVAK